MVPMETHTTLLQKAEDRAVESEMKILQLQTEVNSCDDWYHILELSYKLT